MNLIVHPTSVLSGIAIPPSSKSQNIRGLFFALLAGGRSTLTNVLDSDDMRDAIRVCQALGAKISQQGMEITVESTGLPLHNSEAAINSGNSGITTRFALPLLGYRLNAAEPVVFDCGEQMRVRPIGTLVEALRNLGMQIEYIHKTGACPIAVTGRLRGGKTSVEGLSSQYLSALLIALPCAEQNSEIRVNNLHERPYVEMTLCWLKEQEIHFQHRISGSDDIFNISGGQRYQSFQKMLTGDFSSASYLIAAAALLGRRVELPGLDMQDPQGDKRLVEILQTMGADIVVKPPGLIIHGGKPLTGIEIDANDIPDLLPTLAVIGTQAAGKTVIRNVKQARIKETDRIHSMTQGLTRLGARVEEHEDGVTVYQSRLTGQAVQGFGDHRTVMALAIAGLVADGCTVIDEAESMAKTFPSFIKLMQSLGANMETIIHTGEKPLPLYSAGMAAKHIILLGFKHTGKSTIGRLLAEKLRCPFIDLDQQIEQNYAQQNQQRLACREIYQQRGEAFFRDCETQALRQAILAPLSVIALGGGTPLREENQMLIKRHCLVHITAAADVVYSRIMAHGKPASFPENEDPQQFFQRLWQKNGKIYADLANFSVDNTHSAQQAVTLILKNYAEYL